MSSQSIGLKANIAVHSTTANSAVESWEIHDTIGAFTRQFSLVSRTVDGFQPGRDVAIAAGYDSQNVTLMQGTVDQVSRQQDADNAIYQVVGRDKGSRELHSIRLTFTFHSDPGSFNIPTAHEVVGYAASLAGLNLGNIEFPDYFLYNSYVSIGKRVLDIVAELAEPWNQFARVQYYSQIENKTLSVIRVDWQHPSGDGQQALRSQVDHLTLAQTLYLDEPRLNEVQLVVVRGAAYTKPTIDLGPQTKVEYKKTSSAEGTLGLVLTPVVTELVTTETTYGDKVLSREEDTYIDGTLTAISFETSYYLEPGSIDEAVDLATIDSQSLNPSENALLALYYHRQQGLVQHTTETGRTIYLLEDVFLEITRYVYDQERNLSAEVTTIREYDKDTGQWTISTHTTLTHSQTTGGSVRTHRQSFTFEDSTYVLTGTAAQSVGGGRPSLNQPASRRNLTTVQAQSPGGDLDNDGNVIEPGEGLFNWTYESPYLNQSGCDAVHADALEEQVFQGQDQKWETASFHSLLNPNFRAGRPITIEVNAGVFIPYTIEEVTHSFTPEAASTSVTAKRLTSSGLGPADQLVPVSASLELDYWVQNTHTKTISLKANITAADVGGETWLFDASILGGLNDGDKIASFPDTSGNSHNLSQATGSRKWTFKTGIQNGLSVARSTGADQFMSMTGFSQARQSRTFFWVVSGTVPQTGDAPLIVASSGAGGFDQEFDADAGGLGYFNSGDPYQPGSPGTSGWQVITYRFDSSDNSGKVYRNGTLILTGAFHTGGQTDSNWVIGSYGAGQANFVGDFGEMRLYSSALSAGDLSAVVTFLKTKWGIP